jgi:hypothetical protein
MAFMRFFNPWMSVPRPLPRPPSNIFGGVDGGNGTGLLRAVSVVSVFVEVFELPGTSR